MGLPSKNPGLDPHADAATLPAAQPKSRVRPSVEARRRRALEMYMAGSTMAVIAEQLGWKDQTSAAKAVQAALKSLNQYTPAQLEEARELELARLDKLWQAHYLNAMRGDARATDILLKITDRRAKLMGLDQPREAHVVVTSHLDVEIEQMLERMQRFDDRPVEDLDDDAPAD